MKVYKPARAINSRDQLVLWVCRGELLLGSIVLFVGGFYVRTTGDYTWVLIGSTLLLLSLWHFLRDVDPPTYDRPYETDRLVVRLQRHLSDAYTLALDVPVGETKVDDLVIGSPGVFVIRRCDYRGEINGAKEDEFWTVRSPDGNESEQLPNPFRQNESACDVVRSTIKEEFRRDVPVYNLVVLMYQNVEGSVLDIPELCRLGKVAAFIEEKETPTSGDATLSMDEEEDLEQALGLPDY